MAIKIENLCKNYGKVVAVDNLNLEIDDKQIFALLGLNGAGKSTTINILCTLINKTSGKIFVNGIDLDKAPSKVKAQVSVSPQESAIANNLSVYENLKLMAVLYDVKNYEQKIEQIINEFSLVEKKNARAKTLSGGQKRRLSLAMAIIAEPKILILDEPTLGLDVVSRKQLWQIIEKYRGSMTIILTTHYLEEAEALADKIAIMNRGKVAICGTANQIVTASGKSNFEDAFIFYAGGNHG
jgi:ABC-2 type transport system ATP-binding protein